MAAFGEQADRLYARQLDILQTMRRHAADVSLTLTQLESELADVPHDAGPVQHLVDRLTIRCRTLRAGEKALTDRIELLSRAADSFRTDTEVAKALLLVDSLESELTRHENPAPGS